MGEQVTEPGSKPETMGGAPEEPARGAAHEHMEFITERVANGVTGEQNRKERQE